MATTFGRGLNAFVEELVLGSKSKWQRWTHSEHRRSKFGFPKLTPHQVNAILRENERSVVLQTPGSVHTVDTNSVPSNDPLEDRYLCTKLLHTSGLLFAVIDGHGGHQCAQVVSHRLSEYVGASLLTPELLGEFATFYRNSGETQRHLELADALIASDIDEPVAEADKNGHGGAFGAFVTDMSVQASRGGFRFRMDEALTAAFLRLDDDLSKEAMTRSNPRKLSREKLAVAASGAVACLAHIDGAHVHVANVGDCRAVLGSVSDTGAWVSRPLSRDHSCEDDDEVRRVLSEHPSNEGDSVLRNSRLLGQLAPLRAFGDFRFKWPASVQRSVLAPVFGSANCPPPAFYTPPYLSARPEVTRHRLLPRDRFLVIASDGLWEMMEPSKAVRLVGEYMQGRQTLDAFQLPPTSAVTLGNVAAELAKRREGSHLKPVDDNAATHLIRTALGGTEKGIEHAVLSRMLSAPPEVVRLIRDDITVVVVFFDTEFLRHCPA